MRISDWSSDVCSSDLRLPERKGPAGAGMARRRRTRMSASATDDLVAGGLVSTEWLAARLDDPRVKVLDGTYHLPTAARDGDAEFLERHIPGAARFDIDDV